ncbi:MAG: D-alanyl-D-alanine carboxypeptidase family protein [Bordetella sp.]|uniref:D-alanyl-D-alanine carboxypeptidase family protein n=1 Tax=Bordetella sp. TaxID=28081 RepID=UPI003F7C1E97
MKKLSPSYARLAVASLLVPAAMLAVPVACAADAAPAASAAAPAPAASGRTAGFSSASFAFADPKSLDVSSLSVVPAPALDAKAWIVVDVTSGQILTQSNPDTQVPPASLTKLMTFYLAANAVDENRLPLDQQVTVSERAWRTGGSRMFIQPRLPVTVDQLLQGLIVDSGNDSAVALAEAVAGSVDAFVTLMNQEAQKLGMRDTHFDNVDGLPDPQHVTTARDLAIVATHIIKDHASLYHYFKQKDFTYNNIKQPNRNSLLWADPSVDGMKTGFTDAAGYCMIATAQRGDRRILTVVLGTPSATARSQDSLQLLNWGFQNFDDVKLYGENQPGMDVRVWEGQSHTVRLGPPKPVWLTVPRGKTSDIKPVAHYPDPLIAPLTKGQQVGTLDLTMDGKVVRTEPLVAQTAVERAGFFGRMIDVIKRHFSSK